MDEYLVTLPYKGMALKQVDPQLRGLTPLYHHLMIPVRLHVTTTHKFNLLSLRSADY